MTTYQVTVSLPRGSRAFTGTGPTPDLAIAEALRATEALYPTADTSRVWDVRIQVIYAF